LNILFISAGRRVELVQEFIKIIRSKNIQSRVICADMNEFAPALFFADHSYTIPAINSPEYIPALLKICIDEQVKLIIPTIDTELNIVLQHQNFFKSIGSEVLISSEETLTISNNKMETYRFFKSLGLKTPESYSSGEEREFPYPIFIKPISGSASINTFKVKDHKELEFLKAYIGDYIVQEFIGGEEYTIDVFCDFKGNPIYITPRIRLATRSGEVLKTRINHEVELEKQVLKIIQALKPKGPMTIQAIRKDTDQEYYFIEINARFGGGCPLSMKAGANSAEALFSLLQGQNVDSEYRAAKNGLVFLRFDQSIMLEQRADGSYGQN
jgi:Carbamoylphosphate synthase large subunit (split gene in MJ)